MRETTFLLSNIFLSAGKSIEIAAIGGPSVFGPPYVNDFIHLVDKRLELRALFSSIEYLDSSLRSTNQSTAQMYLESNNELIEAGWDIRYIDNSISNSCIIIDGKVAYILKSDNSDILKSSTQVKNLPFYQIADIDGLEVIYDYFNEFWDLSDTAIPIHENVFNLSLPSIEYDLIQFSQENWNRAFHDISELPDRIHSLNSRQFEYLIAELLQKDGMRVELTPQTRDGGKDIIAFQDSPFGELMFYIECKHNKLSNKVRVDIVRSFYGVLENERVNAGLIVTTSDFTRDAKAFRKSLKRQLRLMNSSELIDWIEKVRKNT